MSHGGILPSRSSSNRHEGSPKYRTNRSQSLNASSPWSPPPPPPPCIRVTTAFTPISRLKELPTFQQESPSSFRIKNNKSLRPDSRHASVLPRLAEDSSGIYPKSDGFSYFADLDLKSIYDNYYLKRLAELCLERWKRRLQHVYSHDISPFDMPYFRRYGKRSLMLWKAKHARSIRTRMSAYWNMTIRWSSTFAILSETIKSSSRQRRKLKQSIHFHRLFRFRSYFNIWRQRYVSAGRSVNELSLEIAKLSVFLHRWKRRHSSYREHKNSIEELELICERRMKRCGLNLFKTSLREIRRLKYITRTAIFYFERKSSRHVLDVLLQLVMRRQLAEERSVHMRLHRERGVGPNHHKNETSRASNPRYHNLDDKEFSRIGRFAIDSEAVSLKRNWDRMKNMIRIRFQHSIYLYAAIQHYNRQVCARALTRFREKLQKIEPVRSLQQHVIAAKVLYPFDDPSKRSRDAASDIVTFRLKEKYQLLKNITETNILHRTLLAWITSLKAVSHCRYVLFEKGITRFLMLITRKTVAMQMYELGESYHSINTMRSAFTKLKKKLLRPKRICTL